MYPEQLHMVVLFGEVGWVAICNHKLRRLVRVFEKLYLTHTSMCLNQDCWQTSLEGCNGTGRLFSLKSSTLRKKKVGYLSDRRQCVHSLSSD